MRNWKNPDDYRFTERLSRELWAWEFLRRNPDYQRDWAWFWSTWQALEAEYGSPPNRDFIRWKSDPRAYVIENGEGVCYGSDSCKVDGEKILIECWLGAKWGFYKFPLDPATDEPSVGEQLAWREVAVAIEQFGPDDIGRITPDGPEVVLGFDLTLPLKEQLEAAKTWLVARQHRLRKEGAILMKSISAQRDYLTLCLRTLDALSQGAGEDEIAHYFTGDMEGAFNSQWPGMVGEAQTLMNGGYRELLRWSK